MSTTEQPSGPRLGTFLGVFTPTILTILGVIMYQRLGWAVGQIGLEDCVLLIALANAITLITTLAFSSVATNVRVGVGGAYNIISRSMGLGIGGAIGLPLFLSQTLSVTLYSFGLAEVLRTVWPEIDLQWATAAIILAVGLLALRGAGVALKVQVPLMALIAISILALVAGATLGDPVVLEQGRQVEPIVPFWVVFAVVFPGVTGIMAGLGLSGDLRDPGRSLPMGSLSAVLVGFVIYITLPFVLSLAASPEALREDTLIWISIAPLGMFLILPGQVGAIFSSAVGSVLCAPRTLQALALDQLAPAWLGRTVKGSDEPFIGVIVTTLLALGAVLLGDLNAVAVVVSMFFLTVYATVNFVAAIETLAGDPSWRPKLRVPWPVTLAGAVACVWVMFMISPEASLVAIAVEIALWLALRRRERKAEWGDVRRGAYETLIRWSLVKLARRPMTARNWRPHVLVFADDVDERLHLVQFGVWFSAGRGVVTVCQLVVGDVMDRSLAPEAQRDRIQNTLNEAKLVAFPEVDIVPNVIHGMVSVAQANGIAGLDSNTVIVGLPSSTQRLADFLKVLRRLETLNRSMVFVRGQHAAAKRARLRVHVWWGGRQSNGDLMLLLAYLLTRNPEWRRALILLLTIPSSDETTAEARAALESLVTEVRIPVRVTVVPPAGRTIQEIIHDRSRAADAVFLGLMVPALGDELAYARRLQELAAPMRTVFFVKNSSLFRGELV